MKHGQQIQGRLTIVAATLTTAALLASAAFAQGAPPQGYPVQTQAYPSYPAPAAAPPQSHAIRDLFAGTIATVLQTATGGLSSALSGSILNWFAKKQAPAAAAGYAATPYPGTSYPSTAYPSQDTQGYATSAYPTSNAYPPGSTSTYPTSPATYPGSSGQYPGGGAQYPGTASTTTPYPGATAQYPGATAQYPGATYPAPATDPAGSYGQSSAYGQSGYPGQTGAYPGATASAYGSAQIYDARTGQVATGGANPYATPAGGYDGTLYAGIAYEVHALSADGRSTPINPATYVFRSGDKFTVYYRPSLPGRMEVYNINPAGQQTLIDSSNMAAGQMTTLGPYQFTNLTGDESLRLVLSPCSSPQLLAATRDIVRADAGYAMTAQASPMASSGGQLSSCSATTTRGLGAVHTRDIQKVAVDGMTAYALDPVSQQELSSGQVTAREANIVFHHR
ncbi:MAG: hypothetical protein WCD08_06320 [Steroidobacteraceae bacterium]